jgi:hypothetical protein
MSILSQDKETLSEEEVYFNFINSIRSEVTKTIYENYVKSFMKFCNVIKLSDLLLIIEPQKQIIKYLMSLRERGLAFNSVSINLKAIYHFYEMNDVILNKKKIKNEY